MKKLSTQAGLEQAKQAVRQAVRQMTRITDEDLFDNDNVRSDMANTLIMMACDMLEKLDDKTLINIYRDAWRNNL